MFAYCANNPVNNSDPYGHSFKKIWNSIGGFLGSIFGAGSSTSLTTINTKLAEFNLLSIISFSSSVKTTKVVSKSGDSSKPISVYANRDAKHPVKSSSAGLKLNIGNTTYKASLGIDDIGVYKSTSNGKATQALGIRINLSELKIGFDHVVSVQEDNDITNSINTNGSFNLFVAIGVVYYIATGKLPSRSPQESPQRSPQGSPI